MAKADIQLGISTKFDGDGLKKLDAGMKDAAKGARTASQALGSISSELGKVGGAAGKATSAISGMVSAISGGPWTVAVAAIVSAIGFIVKAFNDAKEAAKEAAATVRDSFKTALERTEERLSTILKLFQRMKKETAIGAASRTTDVQIAGTKERGEIERRHIEARKNMDNEYDRERDKAAEKREIQLSENAQQLKESQIEVDKLRKNLSAANGEVSTIEKNIKDKKEQLEVQFANTVDETLKAEYEKREKYLQQWQQALKENGADATAYKETRYRTVTKGTMTSIESYQASVTYKEAVERAAKSLNEFKQDNEEALKGIEAYNESLKKLKEDEDKLADAKDKALEATSQYSDAQKKHTSLQEKMAIDAQKADEAYRDQIYSINKREENEKKAKEREEKQEQKEKQAAEKRKKTLAAEDKIEKLQDERASIQEELKKKEQVLSEREKKLSDELKKAEEGARNLKAGFDAAAETARGISKGKWKDAIGQAGGVNQWIGNNERAQNAAWKEARRLQGNQQRAEQQQGNLANKVFDENGNIRRTANLLDVGRFADVSDFLGGKNLTAQQIAGLQKQADNLRTKFFDENGQLRKGVNPASRDLKQLQKLDSLLGKVKKMDDLKKKQEEMKKLEQEKKKLQEETAKATKSIDSNIKEIRKSIKEGMTL